MSKNQEEGPKEPMRKARKDTEEQETKGEADGEAILQGKLCHPGFQR